MDLTFDDDSQIKEAKRDDYLSHLMRLATSKDNISGPAILRKSGLSKYLDLFTNDLTPYSYNGKYQNENYAYRPEMAFQKLFTSIGKDRSHQFLFLKAIVEEISDFDGYESGTDVLNRYLATLGYVIVQAPKPETKGYSLEMVGISIEADGHDDQTHLEEESERICKGSFDFYKQAISCFRNGDFGSCVSTCRIFYEKILFTITNKTKINDAAFSFGNEGFVNGTDSVSDCNKALQYWATHREKIFKTTRLCSLYSFLCGYGSHGDVNPCMDDALWALRETQSTVLWIEATSK